MSVGARCLPTGTRLQVQRAQLMALPTLQGNIPPWSRAQWAVGCQDASTLPALQECSETPPCGEKLPKSYEIPTVVALEGTRGPPLSLSHTPAGDANILPGIVVTLRAMRAFLPSPSSSSSQIAKASNLPAGKAEGKEPLFCR